MGKIFCKYHRQTPARWRCPACNTTFCPQCVKSPAKGSEQRFCPLCKGDLRSLGVGNTIPPFWERIPQFFAYPAKLDNLLYISLFSVLSLGMYLPLVGLVVPLLVLLALLKYAYGLLEHTALGNMEPPTNSSTDYNNLPYKQFVIFVLMSVAVGLCAVFFGPAAAIASYFAVALAMPASVMALAMSGSLLFSMNPANLVRLIGGIGWPYCLLYFFLLLLSSGSGIATELLLPVLPEAAVVVVSSFISAYFIIIMFHMMGYVVYQYHEALGIEGVKEYAPTPAKTVKAADKVDELSAEIDILLSEGRIDEARVRLKQELRHSGVLEHHQRYHKILLLGDDHAELARHTQEYIAILLDKEQKSTALQIVFECVDRIADFALENGEFAYQLANSAFQQGRSLDKVLKLVDGFAERYPRHARIPAAGLIEAKIQCELKFNDGRAKEILEGLLEQYPEDELAGEIAQYLSWMARMQSFAKIPPSR